MLVLNKHWSVANKGPLLPLLLTITSPLPAAARELVVMPVTFKVASHPANVVRLPKGGLANPETVLKQGCEVAGGRCKDMLQSSVGHDDLATIVPNSNGFVYAALEAYGSHHHLRIRFVLLRFIIFISDDLHRPDDVWLAILVQLNF